MRSLPHPRVPALSLCPVVEDHPAAALVAVPHHDTGTSVMHGVRIAAIQRLGDILRDDRRIEIVPWAFPDPGMVCQRSHAVPIAGMVAANLAEWIWTGRLLCFRSHSRCGHPYWVPPTLREEAAKPKSRSQPRQYAKDAAYDPAAAEGV